MVSTHDEFAEWAIDVDQAATAVDVTKEEAKWEKASIYHIPHFIKCEKMTAFIPIVVSFGPFHNGSKNLALPEEHKHIALCHFLKRSKKPLQLFADKLRSVLDQLLESYNGIDQIWKENPDKFLKMMLLDGCFMIEVLRVTEGGSDYANNDPVFGLPQLCSRMPYIKRDMLLLENQLPLLVLKLLLEVESRGPTDDKYINNLVLKFCEDDRKVELQGLGHHPLEVYRMSLLQNSSSLSRRSSNIQMTIKRTPWIQGCVIPFERNPQTNLGHHIRPATTLHECGVNFVGYKECMVGVGFNYKSGTLILPVLTIHDATEHQLLNMVVYEHMHAGAGKEITSFVAFMNELISTAEDVKLLQKEGIIKNELGSHKAIAKIFNTLAKDATPDPASELVDIRYNVNKYCMKHRNKWLASLRHTYFHSPWAAISLVGATLVIILTLIQTVYNILQYYHPHN